jgi:beta-lactamase regulating signal transducer with metallopeptidase domain
MNLLLQWSPSDEMLHYVGLFCVGVAIVVGLATTLAAIAMRRRPAVRHALWLATLICVTVLPLVLVGVDQVDWTWSIQRPIVLDQFAPFQHVHRVSPKPWSGVPQSISSSAPEASTADQVALEAGMGSTVLEPNADQEPSWTLVEWLQALMTIGMLVWLAGIAVLSIRLWRGTRQVARLICSVQSFDNPCLRESMQTAASILRTKTLPTVVVSPDSIGPVVVGLFRPLVILPEEFAKTASVDQMVDVLVHECAHILRHDVWIGLLQRLVQLVCWPHPMISWMNRQLSQAREEVCDNHVLRRGDVTAYAETLLALAERYSSRSNPATTLAIVNPRWKLQDRVAGLLDPQRHSATQVGRAAFLMMMTALLICGGAISAARWQVPIADNAVAAQEVAESPQQTDQTASVSIPVRDLKIERALREYTEISFTENPLEEAIRYLEDLHAIDIQLDLKALESQKVFPDTPVSLVVSGIPLRSALKLILEPMSLATIIENGQLVVTDRVEAATHLHDFTLIDPPVADIVRFGIKPNEVINAIAAVIEPGSWKMNRGRGTLKLETVSIPTDMTSRDALVVHQRLDIWPEVEQLMGELKQAIRDPKEVADELKIESRDYSLKTLHELGYSDTLVLRTVKSMGRFDDTGDESRKRTAKIEDDRLIVNQTRQFHGLLGKLFNSIDHCVKLEKPWHARGIFDHSTIRWDLSPQYIREAIAQPVSVPFRGNPLRDALGYLEDLCRIDIQVAGRLDEREALLSRPLTLSTEHEPMGQVLDKLVQPFGLGWYVVYPEVIVVTTREDAATRLEVRAYRIKELLAAGQSSAALMQQIQKIEPETWSTRGGLGRIHLLPGILLVSQTYHVHHQIGQVLSRE